MSVQFKPTSTANVWTADISTAGIQGTAGTYQLTLKFSDGTNVYPAGSTNTVPAGTLYSITDTSSATGPDGTAPLTVTTGTPPAVGDAASVSIPFTNGAVTQNITLKLGTYGGTAGLTQYSGTGVTVQSLTQNGAAQGTFSNVSIDNNGFVILNYTNGQSLKYFQVPVAQFNASQNLQSLSGETYAQTSTSGQAQIGVSGANGAGTITPSTLEQSNVDIAGQFTNLIVAQEAYTANTKVVSTANQLITALLQIVA
jgi:flagellar hook protein FlgE